MKLENYVVGVALMSASCAHYAGPVSSRSQMTREESMVAVPSLPVDAERQLIEQFDKRGFHLVDRRGDVLIFKGVRGPVMSVGGWRGHTSSSYETIGSIFYARVRAEPNGGALIALLGKPTVDDHPTCSPYDVEFGAPCIDPDVQVLGDSLRLVSGREEADTIHGIIVELQPRTAEAMYPL